MKFKKFEQKYNTIMEQIKNSSKKSIIKESQDEESLEKRYDTEDELEQIGFDLSQPTPEIMMSLLEQAKKSPEITKKVYDTIIQQLRDEDFIEQDEGKYLVDITQFADILYTTFPVEVIQDVEFKNDYKLFQDYYNEYAYDGWSGYADRGGVINDYEVINTIEELFADLGDGTEQNPNIDFSSVYDDWDQDQEEDYDDQDQEEE